MGKDHVVPDFIEKFKKLRGVPTYKVQVKK